jgi:hypothetical protein
LKIDRGSAPNPYWGICTLVICKPAIRRTASVGDWVVGFGSKSSPIGDISGKIVYAMQVTDVVTMKDYDQQCQTKYRNKIPDLFNKDYRRKVGDCQYDFSISDDPTIRLGVHNEINRDRDLSGKNALLSEHFYYFGNKPVSLPDSLKPIIHSTQGHKSTLNDPYVAAFEKWIKGTKYKRNHLHGEPQLKTKSESDPEFCKKCAQLDLQDDEADEKC